MTLDEMKEALRIGTVDGHRMYTALVAAVKMIEEMRSFILDHFALDLDVIPKKWGGEGE